MGNNYCCPTNSRFEKSAALLQAGQQRTFPLEPILKENLHNNENK